MAALGGAGVSAAGGNAAERGMGVMVSETRASRQSKCTTPEWHSLYVRKGDVKT
jgi:hypothetical protein